MPTPSSTPAAPRRRDLVQSDPTLFTVVVRALVDDEHLDADDHGVAGEHHIWLPEEAVDWTQGQQATAVLDDFHDSFAIAMLDDFEISVWGPDGREIYEDDPED